jgi:hypothetical protein
MIITLILKTLHYMMHYKSLVAFSAVLTLMIVTFEGKGTPPSPQS